MGSVLALAGAWLGLEGVDGGLVAFVEAGTDLVPRSHGFFCKAKLIIISLCLKLAPKNQQNFIKNKFIHLVRL